MRRDDRLLKKSKRAALCLLEVGMWEQVAQWLIEHVWLAPAPPVVWFLQRTRTARTIATVLRGEVRDRWLRAKGVSEETRHELAIDAVRRDLESS